MRHTLLASSPFTRKARHTYFDVSLILHKVRHALLMLVSIYPIPSPEMCTYMWARLTLLDRRRLFKGLSPICVSYLSFLRVVATVWHMQRARLLLACHNSNGSSDISGPLLLNTHNNDELSDIRRPLLLWGHVS
jgi:hypothetical protein